MSTATAATAKAQPPARMTLRDQMQGDKFRSRIEEAAGKMIDPKVYLAVALNSLNRVPKLMECTPESVLQCVLNLAPTGLVPDGRRAHLIPFNDFKTKTVICTLIIDYKGLVELVWKSGNITYIHADVICKNDLFKYSLGKIEKHEYDLASPRGEVVGAYALVGLQGGETQCAVMSLEEINGIRSRSKSGNNGPWVSDYAEMAKKTAFRRLTKWLNLSPEAKAAIDAEDDYITQQGKPDRPNLDVLGERMRAKPADNQETADAPSPSDDGAPTAEELAAMEADMQTK